MSGVGPISETPAPLNLYVGPFDPRAGYSVDVTYPGANYAYAWAFQVTRRVTVTKARYWAGSVSSGNVDLGIYTDGVTGNRLASTGSTAMGSAYGQREIDLTAAVTLVPGVRYWATISCDNTTAKFFGAGAAASQAGGGDAYSVINTSGMFPLPANLNTTAKGSCPSLWIAFFTA